MRIKVYLKDDTKDYLIVKYKNKPKYSFINLTDGYIDDLEFDNISKSLEYLDEQKSNNSIKGYKVIDNDTFLEDGIFIGNYFVPNKNPKRINCTRDELIFDGNKIVGLKKLKFTCDNCSSPMNVIHGPHGYFLGCANWKTSPSCKKNTISLNILDE